MQRRYWQQAFHRCPACDACRVCTDRRVRDGRPCICRCWACTPCSICQWYDGELQDESLKRRGSKCRTRLQKGYVAEWQMLWHIKPPIADDSAAQCRVQIWHFTGTWVYFRVIRAWRLLEAILQSRARRDAMEDRETKHQQIWRPRLTWGGQELEARLDGMLQRERQSNSYGDQNIQEHTENTCNSSSSAGNTSVTIGY